MPLLTSQRKLIGRRAAWYRSAGAPAPVVAYQPKGAASLAASYVNLVSPGTNDAAPGTAPTFAAATGWAFDGNTQWLSTGITSTANMSVVIRFSDAVTEGGYMIGFINSGISSGYAIQPILSPNVRYWNGASATKSPTLATGVLAIAGTAAYRNGVDEGVTLGNNPAAGILYIGGRNREGVGFQSGIACKIQAVAIYSSVLTPAQVAAVSTAMAAL